MEIKVALLGEIGMGKSSLMLRLLQNIAILIHPNVLNVRNDLFIAESGADFHCVLVEECNRKNFTVDDETIILSVLYDDAFFFWYCFR